MSDLVHSLLFFPFFFFFLISVDAQSNDGNYPNCPSYRCGHINISYPFWRIGNETTPQFCGYHDFGINCSDDGLIPSINLGDDSYYIHSIVYKSKSIVLVNYDVFIAVSPGDCPRVRHNISIETLPFKFLDANVNLSFHFNCNGVPDFATEIRCLRSGTKKSCVNSVRSKPTNFSWDEYSCDDHVETTVLPSFDSGSEIWPWREIIGGLRRGFELLWWRTEDCDKCEESGGRCGYNKDTTEFKCFCSVGTTTLEHCNLKDSGFNWKIKLGVGIVSGVLGIILMGAIWYFWRKRHIKKRYYGSSYMSRNISSYPSSITDPEKNETYHGVQVFKYRELEKATNYFDSKKELGDGGFGTVYHGKLKDGREVAVKRLYENNYKRVEQFMNEVGILAHLRHRNLVSLYGCTNHHSRELLLVYEYIPNGTVADHLHGEKSNPGSLPWSTRINIATETASALVYLHASDVVHRDVKTNNILLDNSFSVKVADFGLSRLFPTDVTHVSTAPQGTPGYVDPEYHECYQLTSKSDVYSFGVVLIELISSKPAVDITRHRHEINLSNMALNKIRNDALGELVDPNLGFETDYEVRKMINAVAELAFRCLQNEREGRPAMEEVLEYLISIQNGGYNKEKDDHVLDDDSLSLKDHSQTMSPDSVAIAWSTSTLSNSGG